jgi:GNAT superfamily N-acetyltransferase
MKRDRMSAYYKLYQNLLVIIRFQRRTKELGMQKQKIILLKSAWKKGWLPFLRQFIRSVRDTLFSKHHYIYSLDISNMDYKDKSRFPDLKFRVIRNWEDLDAEVLARLKDEQEYLGWGDFGWLTDLEYQLIVGEIDGKIAGLGWLRNNQQAQDFFVPLPDNAELVWQTTVLPEYRGKKLFDKFLWQLMIHRAQFGTTLFFINCRDYNTTTQSSLARMGWSYLGYVAEYKRSGKRQMNLLKTPVPAQEIL